LIRGFGLKWHMIFLLTWLEWYVWLFIKSNIQSSWTKPNHFGQKLPLGSNQVGLLVKLDKTKWHVWSKWLNQIEHLMYVLAKLINYYLVTNLATYLPIEAYLPSYLLTSYLLPFMCLFLASFIYLSFCNLHLTYFLLN